MEVSGEQTRWWGLLKGGVGSRLLSELKLLVTGTFEHIVERNRNVFLSWREGGWQNLGEGFYHVSWQPWKDSIARPKEEQDTLGSF